ncbi:MAG TPA: hypothetical protein VNT55_01540 [Baekduia sp.]|nr:hypothetical protein [Baekduia sp.]
MVAISLAAGDWLLAERWLDGRLRDVACSVGVASGNHCYDPARPSSSVVPWVIGALLLVVLTVVATLGRARAATGLTACATALAMVVAVLVVRSGDDGFAPLGQDRGPTAGDVAWTSLALLALLAVAALGRRASAPGHRRTSPPA